MQEQQHNLSDKNELHQIRSTAKNISDQLYFLSEVLKPLASQGATGKQLYPVAIQGLCNQLLELENKAVGISCAACRILDLPEDAVENDFA